MLYLLNNLSPHLDVLGGTLSLTVMIWQNHCHKNRIIHLTDAIARKKLFIDSGTLGILYFGFIVEFNYCLPEF